MAGKGTWESWNVHRERIDAEKKRAVDEHLCPEVVNDEWAHGYTGRKVCLKKPSPDSLQIGLELCGVHLRGHLKMEREAADRAAASERSKKDNERRAKLEEIKEAQEKRIHTLISQAMGLDPKDVDVSRAYGWGSRKRPWQVTIPLSAVWKIIDELPMLDPDEAVEVYEENERRAAEAAKPTNTPAPF